MLAWSVGAGLVDPGPGGGLAGILPPRYRLAAATTALSGRTGSISLPIGRVSSDPAEPDRAGAGHGQPGTPWAEVLQMSLAYPLAHRHPLPAGPLGVLACAISPAHARQAWASAQALALSHRDPLQVPCPALPHSSQGLQAPYLRHGTLDRCTVSQALPPGRTHAGRSRVRCGAHRLPGA